jgi:UDP:flavonoid glycosyltransferase YjiC (YdhE family)
VRVLFACTQDAGHFNPLVPFVEACRRAGDEVLVVGLPPLAESVKRVGFPFWLGRGAASRGARERVGTGADVVV